MKFQVVLFTVGIAASLVHTSFGRNNGSSNSLDREINIHAPPSGYSLSISREPNKGFFGRRIKQFTVTDLVPGQGHTLQIIEGGVNSTFVLFTITSGHNKGVSVKVHLEYYDKAEDKQKL